MRHLFSIFTPQANPLKSRAKLRYYYRCKISLCLSCCFFFPCFHFPHTHCLTHILNKFAVKHKRSNEKNHKPAAKQSAWYHSNQEVNKQNWEKWSERALIRNVMRGISVVYPKIVTIYLTSKPVWVSLVDWRFQASKKNTKSNKSIFKVVHSALYSSQSLFNEWEIDWNLCWDWITESVNWTQEITAWTITIAMIFASAPANDNGLFVLNSAVSKCAQHVIERFLLFL